MPGGEADALTGDQLKEGDILLRFNLSLVSAGGSSDVTVIASGTRIRYGTVWDPDDISEVTGTPIA
jgi:hypothetical protein